MVVWQFLLLLLGFAHNYSMPTASMQPTLMVGDVFEARLTRLYGLVELLPTTPRLGDIVIFYNPPTKELYVKRVVGLAGERIYMADGRLFIDDVEVPRRFVGNFSDSDSYGMAIGVARYVEALPGGIEHFIHEISDDQPLDNTAEFVVPTGKLFVMGDNRDRSVDSRIPAQVGYVDLSNVVAIIPGPRAPYFWHRRQ